MSEILDHSARILHQAAEAEQRRERRQQALRRGLQWLDLAFYLLYCVVGLQILLEAMGARDWVGFKHFLDVVGRPFLSPFRGLFEDPHLANHQLMGSYVFALLMYLLLQSLLHKVVKITTGVSSPGI